MLCEVEPILSPGLNFSLEHGSKEVARILPRVENAIHTYQCNTKAVVLCRQLTDQLLIFLILSLREIFFSSSRALENL